MVKITFQTAPADISRKASGPGKTAALWMLLGITGAAALVSLHGLWTPKTAAASDRTIHYAYPHLEASFPLPHLTGNPFDYTENDIQVTLEQPDGTRLRLPAFFDGGTTWRVRCTPTETGTYRVTGITRNGAAVDTTGVQPSSWNVGPNGKTEGFVRRDRTDTARFVFDSGAPYYPLGHNVAWQNAGGKDIPTVFARMGAVGENWSRVWMDHWDNKNLDWPAPTGDAASGQLDLTVARKWDGIVQAADTSGIHFQLTLQHHGQWSTSVNPNWNENPWNVHNTTGKRGFLNTPEAFFTDPTARRLTRAKYRYILARWGYSPAILSWELFNEVQFTDAVRNHHTNEVLAWHREMAQFLRAQDPYHHLITTSSDPGTVPGLFDDMDYAQPHAYPQGALTAIAGLSNTHPGNKPTFFGEFGPESETSATTPAPAPGPFLHTTLWGSAMSSTSSGAAQFWAWDTVEKNNLYPAFRSLRAYLDTTKLPALSGLTPITPTVRSTAGGTLVLTPGNQRTPGTAPLTCPIAANGDAPAMAGMPSYLYGAHPGTDLPSTATFSVDYPAPGRFAVILRQVAKTGATLTVQIDGHPATTRAYTPAATDRTLNDALVASIPAGPHTITITNTGTGTGWALIGSLRLAPYGNGSLHTIGKGDRTHAAVWIYNADSTTTPTTGTLTLSHLAPGTYHLLWWDTYAGKLLTEQTITTNGPLTTPLPPFHQDVAAFVEPR